MQIAIDVAGFSATEADQLRQAMGSKRSALRMLKIQQRLYEGMFARGVSPEVADRIYAQLAAFANYGFPESHAVSFAYLVYASAWFKLHHPEAFLAGLLNAQPMGFWSPQSLVADARRHGVIVHGAHVNSGRAHAGVVDDAAAPHGYAVRLGVGAIRGIGSALARVIEEGRPYASLDELARHTHARADQLERLATAGACRGIGVFSDAGGEILHRRQSIWALGALATPGEERLAGIGVGATPPALRPMDSREETVADLSMTGIALGEHPLAQLREMLGARGVLPIAELATTASTKVLIAGIITHRQRPGTASGMVFLNVEDEGALTNVICSPGFWLRYRRELLCAGIIVRGRLERAHGVISVVAERAEELILDAGSWRSRDFH